MTIKPNPKPTGMRDKDGQPIDEGSMVRWKHVTGIVFAEAGAYYVNRAGKCYDERGQLLSSVGFAVHPPAEWRVIGHVADQPPADRGDTHKRGRR